MTTAPHLDSTKSVGRTFQSVKRLWCRQNDRPESRSHMSEAFFNTLLDALLRATAIVTEPPVRPACRQAGDGQATACR